MIRRPLLALACVVGAATLVAAAIVAARAGDLRTMLLRTLAQLVVGAVVALVVYRWRTRTR
jgi:hypothetical protein